MDHSAASGMEMQAMSSIDLQRSMRSEWESVFSSVKAQVPSLDSDTSLSDGEDSEISIFQRDKSIQLPDMTEDLSDILSEDPEMQEIYGSTQPFEYGREEVLGTFADLLGGATIHSVPGTSCDPTRAIPLSSVAGENLEQSGTKLANHPVSQRTEECHTGQDTPTNVPLAVENHPSGNLRGSQDAHNKKTEVCTAQEKETRSQYPRAFSNPETLQQPHFQHAQRGTRDVPREQGVLPKPRRGLSLQSLQCIDQWDLDSLLQRLEQQGDGIMHTEKTTSLTPCPVGRSLRSEAKVMEQLKLLCAKQSEATSYTHRSTTSTQSMPTKPSSPRKDPNKNSGVCLSQPCNGESENVNLNSAPLPPTIYIDLRNSLPERYETLPLEVPDMGQDPSLNCTGKSLLLMQLRHSRKAPDPQIEPPLLASPQEAESRPDDDSIELGGAPVIRRKRRSKVREMWSKVASPKSQVQLEAENESCPKVESLKGAVHLEAEAESSLITAPEHFTAGSPKGSLQLEAEARSSKSRLAEEPNAHLTRITVQKEPEKDLCSESVHQTMHPLIPPVDETKELSRAVAKQAGHVQREDELKEKHRRQRLQQQLEALKPRHSIAGKQPMAEKTPVLFHLEASYLPDISMLPTAIAVKQEMLLMTIWLSSCGHVTSVGLPGGRSQETAVSAANIYHALVTWLISLVPAINVQGTDKWDGSTDAPFQVVGLQQTWREDGLALYACLVPIPEVVQESSPKSRKHKTKEDLRGMSTFYQNVSKYLSHTWLQSITWWRDALNHCLQDQIFPVLPEVPAMRLSSVTTINPDPEAVEKAFASPRGFYWQTVETDEKICSIGTDQVIDADTETEVALAILFETLLSDPMALHHMLQLTLSSCLDICGLRLLYPQPSVLLLSTEHVPSSYIAQSGKAVPPVLAIALRGTQARTMWQDICGPTDPQLACLTDCHSLNALYCQSREEPLLYSPHTDGRILQELCVWFGGRVPSDGVVHVGIQNPSSKSKPRSQSPSSSDGEEGFLKGVALSRPPATLISTSKGDIFLSVSPAVPPSAYGDVISTCTRRGFVLQGVRRLRISTKRANMLSMSASQISVFCRNKATCQLDSKPWHEDLAAEPHLHTLLLLLRKENVGHHILAMIKGMMNELAEQGFLAEIRRSIPPGTELQPSLCFHVAHYTDNLLQGLGGSLSTVPECGSVALDMLSLRNFASNPEMEQVVILTLTGKDAMKGSGALLRSILRPGAWRTCRRTEKEDSDAGFELLGLKWLPSLSRSQAKEVTPFEVGDRPWQQSIDELVSSPALICALRRINAFVVLSEALKAQEASPPVRPGSRTRLQRVMSSTPEMAFRQAALFFTEKDFVSDARNRPALKYIPPPNRGNRIEGEEARKVVTESVFSYMLSGPQLICTLLLLKPGVWARNLPKIIRKLYLERFRVVGMKHLKLDLASATTLLQLELRQDLVQLQEHCSYLTSDLSLVLCLQRQNAVKKLLDLLGPENPNEAQAQDQFLWRGQYGINPVQNGFYGSTCYQNAVRDMKMFFPEGLCCAQSPVLEEERIFNARSDPLVNLEFRRQRQIMRQKLTRKFSSPGLPAHLCSGLPLHSALCQTTCLVLPEGLLQGSDRPSYIQLLEQLVSKEFVFTGARLTRLDQTQAHLVAEILSPIGAASATRSLLSGSSCLVLAAQRDNAVSCFHSLLDSADFQRHAVQDCIQRLLYPESEKQAEELLCCFFDSLTLDSIHQMVEKAV
ncbi:dynein axonemal assembly factor 8 [Ambystoma mexicanum]|uniref:dynein axonemal assembly factor 8 n=1 Tax=Ambystoma mexicanum TaxID=8296 RepID=UPI0037E735A2